MGEREETEPKKFGKKKWKKTGCWEVRETISLTPAAHLSAPLSAHLSCGAAVVVAVLDLVVVAVVVYESCLGNVGFLYSLQ